MPEVLQSKTAGQSLSSIWPEVPERHPDTEEVTGSNPVRPTPFFENPSSAESLNGSQPAAVLSNKRTLLVYSAARRGASRAAARL